MGVYRVKVKGREDAILLRAKSKTEAIDAVVVEAKALTGEEVEDALAEGAKLWKPEEPLPGAPDAAELQWLRHFYNSADFGPGHGDVMVGIRESYEAAGNTIPDAYAEEDEA